MRKMVTSLALVSCCAVSSVLSAWSGDSVADRESRYLIRLGGVEVIPEPGSRAGGLDHGETFLLQLNDLPMPEERESLLASGVELLRYVGGNAYLARCRTDCDPAPQEIPAVRAVLEIQALMKRSRIFDTDRELVNRREGRQPVPVHLQFVEGTSFDRAGEILDRHGVVVTQSSFDYQGSLRVDLTPQTLDALLEEPEIVWVDPALPAPGPASVDSGHRTRVDQIRWQELFFEADGTGERVAVWDWFPGDTHIELEDRVIDFEVRWGESAHGLLVSGVIAAIGQGDPRSLGMAPGAELVWHSYDANDLWSDMVSAQQLYDVSVVNNSWSIHPGWFFDRGDGHPVWHGGLWAYGYYHLPTTGSADHLVHDTGLALVFAVGNEVEVDYLGPHHHGDFYGGELPDIFEDLHPPNPVYTSLAGASVAKNVITVGGSTKEDDIAVFSSRGPTLDGRVKPDVVAPAVDILTTAPGDEYWYGGGTSLSAPAVCGISVLLRDYFRRVHGDELGSAVLKNLLIHSARDRGLPGPDYTYGHGLVDAELAARIIRDAVFDDDELRTPRRPSGTLQPTPVGGEKIGEPRASSPEEPVLALMVEGVADHGDVHTYRFPVASARELRASLVWHDPWGSRLVNDLDLRLTRPDGRLVWPAVLVPEEPGRPAGSGRNSVDNVEHVRASDPQSGWWTVVIEGHAVAMGPQPFSLVVSASDGNVASERHHDGDTRILEFWPTRTPDDGSEPELTTVFHRGDPLNFVAVFEVLDNAVYEHYFGSVTLWADVRNASGEIVVTASLGSHLWSDGRVEAVLDTGWIVPADLPPGEYAARFGVRLHNGREATADTTLLVE